MLLYVKDGANGLPIEGATVLVRKDSDDSTVFSGTTDSEGKVDFTLPPNVAHNALAYKPGAYDGARVSVVNSGGTLYPSTISLLKITSRTMKVAVFVGGYSTPLAGATVQIKKPDASIHLTAGTGPDGKYQTNLQADLSGWTVAITQPGLDGVVLPLDKIDLVGEVKVVLAPTI